jgi:predicted MFS family arabinose efflux permease
MSRRVAASQFILVGSLIGAAACGLLALSVGVVTALVACVLIGVAWASMHSSLQTWATEVSPADRGLTVSFFAGSLFAGSALAAALGGPFAERLDFTALYLTAGLVLVTIGVCGYIARAHWEHRQ